MVEFSKSRCFCRRWYMTVQMTMIASWAKRKIIPAMIRPVTGRDTKGKGYFVKKHRYKKSNCRSILTFYLSHRSLTQSIDTNVLCIGFSIEYSFTAADWWLRLLLFTWESKFVGDLNRLNQKHIVMWILWLVGASSSSLDGCIDRYWSSFSTVWNDWSKLATKLFVIALNRLTCWHARCNQRSELYGLRWGELESIEVWEKNFSRIVALVDGAHDVVIGGTAACVNQRDLATIGAVHRNEFSHENLIRALLVHDLKFQCQGVADLGRLFHCTSVARCNLHDNIRWVDNDLFGQWRLNVACNT